MTDITTTSTTTERPVLVENALGLIAQAKMAAEAYEREDLVTRLAGSRARLIDPAFHILIVGEFKQGKSSLVNALLNAPVCPVDDDIATSAPTAVRYAQEPSAAVMLWPPDASDADEKPDPVRQEIPVDQIQHYVTETANPGNERRVHSVEIGVPRQLLANGLVLVDTPGVGGLGSVHSSITIGALPMADAVVFVSDASQEFSEPELHFLKTARSMCPNVLCVLTKTDFYPEWRKIRDLDEGHLRDAKIKADILPVSSSLRTQALESDDAELDGESGFPDLVRYLQQEIVANAEAFSARAACNDVSSVVDQLDAKFQAERQALDQPEKAADLVAGLEKAKERADRLRGQAAKWQQTLGDGVGDLSSDIDHDLRSRIRAILQETDVVIEETDPVDMWEEFEPWLYRRAGEDVANNYKVLQGRAEELAERVGEHFSEGQENVTAGLDLGGAALDVNQLVQVEADLEVKRMGVRESMFTGVRGGYMGVIMFSALGGMVGLALGPLLPVAAGLMMGRKSLKDEKQRQLNNRRAQGKNAVRKYLDEVSFVAGKDTRDRLRQIQRQLRDHYSTRAEELNRSLAESLKSAQHAVQTDQSARQGRLRDVDAELGRIRNLKKAVRELSKELEPAAVASASV